MRHNALLQTDATCDVSTVTLSTVLTRRDAARTQREPAPSPNTKNVLYLSLAPQRTLLLEGHSSTAICTVLWCYSLSCVVGYEGK